MDKVTLKLFSKKLHRELQLSYIDDEMLRAVVYVGSKTDIMVVWASEKREEFRWDSIEDHTNENRGFWLGRACFDVTPEEMQKISEAFYFPLPEKEEQAA